jgi:hypothetical protein
MDGLRGMTHGDLHLRRYFTEWSEDPVFSSFTFGNYLLVKYETDMLASHHHGFSQGAQAALILRQERKAEEEASQAHLLIWATLATLGGGGLSLCIWTLARVDSPIAWVVACVVAGPFILVHLAGSFMLVQHWLKPYTKESNVVPIEYDPDKKAVFLEREEERALKDFLQSRRDMGGDESSTDV